MRQIGKSSLSQLLYYFLKLGTSGFGGPVALIGFMHRDLVEKRGWISEEEYKQGLALAELAPGPLAAQLAIYLGYVDFGIWGATLTGFVFVLPSFLMVLALGWAYTLYGGLPWMHSVFYAVGACVIGIITNSVYKLTRKTLKGDKLLWLIFAVLLAVTVIAESEIVWLFLGGGVLVWFLKAPPWKGKTPKVPLLAVFPFSLGISQPGILMQIFIFFAKAGTLVFGSGLAIVPFLYGGVVKEHHWLTDQQFLDAVAVAMITPGPVVITVGFIGYLVAGLPGACVAALSTFLPCYLFVIILAPYFRKHGKKPGLVAFVDGVTAAAIGAIAGAVIILGRRSVVDIPTALIALATAFILWKTKKIPEPVIVIIAAILGLVLSK